jgi:hypothetical protein
MENQMQQPQEQTITSLEVSTGSSTLPKSNLSPTEQSIKKGQWLVTQIFSFLVQIFDNLGSFFKTSKQLLIATAIVVGAIVALKLVIAVMSALNDIPLLASTFKLIGVSYSAWFVYRYLLKPSTRQELYQALQNFLGKQIAIEDETT